MDWRVIVNCHNGYHKIVGEHQRTPTLYLHINKQLLLHTYSLLMALDALAITMDPSQSIFVPGRSWISMAPHHGGVLELHSRIWCCGNGRRNRKDSRWQSLGYDQPPEHIGCSAYYGGLWWSLSERHVDHGPHVYAHQFWNRVLVPQRFFHKLRQAPSRTIASGLDNSFKWSLHAVPTHLDPPFPWRRFSPETAGNLSQICPEEQSALVGKYHNTSSRGRPKCCGDHRPIKGKVIEQWKCK